MAMHPADYIEKIESSLKNTLHLCGTYDEAILRMAERVASMVHYKRNSQLPWQRLPREILDAIFLLATNGDPAFAVTLSLVCQHWRKEVLRYPGLWRHVSLKRGLRCAQLWSEMARPVPLSITAHYSSILASFIQGNASRIETLHIDLTDDSTVDSALALIMPAAMNLQHLTLHHNVFESTFPLTSIPDATPVLKSFTLLNLNIAWQTVVPTNLVSLTVKCDSGNSSATQTPYTLLFDSLTCMRRIETLHLENAAPIPPPRESIHVSLPRLMSLYLGTRSSTDCVLLARAISGVEGMAICLKVDDWSHASPRVESPTIIGKYLESLFSTQILHTFRLSMRFNEAHVAIWCVGQNIGQHFSPVHGPRFLWRLGDRHITVIPSILQALDLSSIQIAAFTDITRMRVVFDSASGSIPTVLPSISRFTGLKKVHFDVPNPWSLFPHLLQFDGTFAVPRLQHLAFNINHYEHDDHTGVVQWVRARQMESHVQQATISGCKHCSTEIARQQGSEGPWWICDREVGAWQLPLHSTLCPESDYCGRFYDTDGWA